MGNSLFRGSLGHVDAIKCVSLLETICNFDSFCEHFQHTKNTKISKLQFLSRQNLASCFSAREQWVLKYLRFKMLLWYQYHQEKSNLCWGKAYLIICITGVNWIKICCNSPRIRKVCCSFRDYRWSLIDFPQGCECFWRKWLERWFLPMFAIKNLEFPNTASILSSDMIFVNKNNIFSKYCFFVESFGYQNCPKRCQNKGMTNS